MVAKKKTEKVSKIKKISLAHGIKLKKLDERDLSTISDYGMLYPHWDKAKIAKKLKKTAEGKDARFIAVKKGKIIGQIKVEYGKSIHAHRAELVSLIVLPTERRQGIGTALTEYSLKHMPREISVVLLAVDRKNRKAITIYKKLGFKKYGMLKKASKIKGKYVDNLFMEKSA